MRKLYYEDCHLTEFTAQVVSCTRTEKGWEVLLHQTAFYPEGGGQPCDLGTLDGVTVVDVQERGEDVIHLCDGPLPVGETVTGRIDFARRFDFMQQHTGEHIVSGLLHQRLGCHNVGFHMGKTLMTVDFDTPVPPEILSEVEREANAAIWKNLPVKTCYPSPEELEQLPYRTKRALPWPVRIVEIPGYDRCACCGVHAATTGEVGLVKIFSCVKFHNGVRLEMACGQRALDMLTKVFDQNKLVSQAFSAEILDTGAAAQRMNQALSQEKFQRTALENRIFQYIAKEYAGKGNILHFEDNMEPGQLRLLADAIAETCGGVAAVFAPGAQGYAYCLMSRTENLAPLGKAMNAALHGRGGGKPTHQQGNVGASRGEIENYFSQLWHTP